MNCGADAGSITRHNAVSGTHVHMSGEQDIVGNLFVSFRNYNDSYFLCVENELDDCTEESQGMQLGEM